MTTRRTLLACAGACALAGCQVYGASSPPPAAPAGELRVEDIPVGGGRILPDRKVVLTRPEPDVVKAFSAVCTHQGCLVTGVADGTITCSCHGSAFHIGDGSVASGPAKQPLPSASVTVTQGGTITLDSGA